MEKFSVVMTHAKTTKGTHQFQEVPPADGSRPIIGSMYITKAQAGDNPPARIKVSVKVESA